MFTLEQQHALAAQYRPLVFKVLYGLRRRGACLNLGAIEDTASIGLFALVKALRHYTEKTAKTIHLTPYLWARVRWAFCTEAKRLGREPILSLDNIKDQFAFEPCGIGRMIG